MKQEINKQTTNELYQKKKPKTGFKNVFNNASIKPDSFLRLSPFLSLLENYYSEHSMRQSRVLAGPTRDDKQTNIPRCIL